MNIALSSRVPEVEVEKVKIEIDRRLFQISEVKFNTIRVLPLKEVLDLLGMETQLKEKRIVDLRSAQLPKTGEALKH